MDWRARIGLLGTNSGYAALWGARTVSSFGNWVTLTALLLYLESSGATGFQVGILIAARELPHLLGPLTGALADRFDPKRVMVGCDLVNSLLIGTIALLLPPFPVLVALVTLSASTTALFMPSGKSAIPKLVPRSELTSANALIGSSTNLSFAVGPVAGAAVFAGFGVQAALLLDAATFLVSTSLLLLLPALGQAGTPGTRSGVVSDIREGIRFVAGHRASRAVAIGMFIGVLFAGIDNVALVFLLRDTLGGPEVAVGTALGAYAAAMVITPLVMIRLPWLRRRPGWIVIFGLLTSSAGLLLTGLSPVVAVAIGMYAVAGAGNGLENIGVDTVIGRSVPPEKLGRAFGVTYGPIFIAGGAAALIGGQIVDLLSPPVAFVIAGVGVAIGAAIVWRMLGGQHSELQTD